MKTTSLNRKLWSWVLVSTLLFGAGMAFAQDYPTRPVQILIGNIPGGPSDLGTRALIEAAKQYFPQPFVPVNKPGGGGTIMTYELIRSAPDGYTIGLITQTFVTVNPHLQSNIPYKGPNDIQPIISMFDVQEVLVVKADSQFKTVQEFIAYAKANPGKLRVGFAGVGTGTHTHLMSLKLAGVPVTEVPLVGAADSITALLGGHIEGVVLNVGPVLPHVRAGTLKYLALFTEQREESIPELKGVPTLWELGYKDTLTDGAQYVLIAPKNTPTKIVTMLHDVFLKAQKSESFQKFCRDNGFVTAFRGPDQLKSELEKNFQYYGVFLKKAGIEKQ
jgi:tripartite-type tricarboxylate transporter receptor subunit TctC